MRAREEQTELACFHFPRLSVYPAAAASQSPSLSYSLARDLLVIQNLRTLVAHWLLILAHSSKRDVYVYSCVEYCVLR